MEFIIVYNPGQRNYFIHESSQGFIETFSSIEKAKEVAIENISDDINSFAIYELSKD